MQTPLKTPLKTTFEVKSWDESPFDDETSVPKIIRAIVSRQYSGDVEGSSMRTQWLMAYADDGSATFVGLERVAGQVGGKQGTLVLRHVGSNGDGAAKAKLAVVDCANSNQLKSATGDGDLLADPSRSVTLNLTNH